MSKHVKLCRSTSQLLTLDQVADRVGCSVRQVRRFVDRREIEHVRLGPRMVRVTEDALARFVETSTQRAVA
jgi:excisionase family DNA binding protein